MNVNQNFVSASKWGIKCPYTMNAEFYIVHNTANDASAENEIAYMIRNDNEVSFHYAIDDKEIWQGVPENRNTWNAGDGEHGNGNRCGIAIEICYSLSGGDKFIAAEKNAAKFIANGLKEKGWGIERVKKHQDFSGKYCPHRTLDMGWQRFLDMVKAEMGEVEQYKPTVREWQTAAVADGFTFPVYGIDGIWGDECASVATNAIVRKRSYYTNKNLTRIVQRVTGAEVDGLCGSETDACIRSYQSANSLVVDGIVGIATWKKILGVE